MNKKISLLAASILLSFNSYSADININGFASIIGGVTTSSDDSLYGYDDNIDFSNESLMALQFSSDLGEGFGVTAQVIAKGVDDWDPDFAWAYVSYDVNDQIRLLIGKQRAPFYMYSEYLDVSYAYSWITPPKGVYNLPFDSFDGVSASYSMSFDEVDATFQVIYGGNDESDNILGEEVDPDYKKLWGVTATMVRDWLTLRAAYITTELTIPITGLEQLSDGWESAGFSDIADNVSVNEDQGTFMGIGFQVDYDNYLLLGEFTHRTIDDSPIGDADSYYFTAGRRFDNVLLTLTYGKDDDDIENLTGDVPYGIHPSIDYLKAVTDGTTESFQDDSNYVTLGLRWDFHSSAAFKAEYTTYSDDVNDNNDADLVRVAVVTVF